MVERCNAILKGEGSRCVPFGDTGIDSARRGFQLGRFFRQSDSILLGRPHLRLNHIPGVQINLLPEDKTRSDLDQCSDPGSLACIPLLFSCALSYEGIADAFVS
jgi:hypothetical protein